MTQYEIRECRSTVPFTGNSIKHIILDNDLGDYDLWEYGTDFEPRNTSGFGNVTTYVLKFRKKVT